MAKAKAKKANEKIARFPEVERLPKLDMGYVGEMLRKLLDIPSPTGYTDNIVHFVCEELTRLGVEFDITRRGAIRANLSGKRLSPDRAVVSHLDTLGAMVKQLKENGRLEVVPIGTWSARFAEGTRCTVFTDEGPRRGTILPLKASGHVYNTEIDTQPIDWGNLELRVDEKVGTMHDLVTMGFNVGDFIAIDPQPEFDDQGFINSRHLDDKAGVAAMLGAARAVVESGRVLPVACHLIFTIAEEVGVGVPGTLEGDVGELVTIDNGTIAPGQNTAEYGVTVAIQDETGPFDYHLVRKLISVCQTHNIPYARDVFKYYRSDAGAALASGNDLRHALICFALDSSHGYERTHVDSLQALGQLVAGYMLSEPTLPGDTKLRDSIEDFPSQPD